MKIKILQPTTYNLQPSRGFTLVEMLVSISVFMVVMTVASGSLLSVIDANSKAQSLKSAVNNLNFAIESMAKEIRMGNTYADCSSPLDKTCISFISSKDINVNTLFDDRVYYKYINNAISRCIKSTCSDDVNFTLMTAPGVIITNLKFYIIGTNPARVLITISGEAGTKTKLKTKFNLQTTVSQRSF